MKRLVWSGIGFTLVIVAFTLEYYFLVNAAFGWAVIEEGSSRTNGAGSFDSVNGEDVYIFTLTTSSGGILGANYLEAFKAAIANIVAFSAVIGRAGLLEAWFIVFVGTVGYELNRVLITMWAVDGPGTAHVFIYGAFLGMVSSILLRCR